jgi:hypothetical protein
MYSGGGCEWISTAIATQPTNAKTSNALRNTLLLLPPNQQPFERQHALATGDVLHGPHDRFLGLGCGQRKLATLTDALNQLVQLAPPCP